MKIKALLLAIFLLAILLACSEAKKKKHKKPKHHKKGKHHKPKPGHHGNDDFENSPGGHHGHGHGHHKPKPKPHEKKKPHEHKPHKAKVKPAPKMKKPKKSGNCSSLNFKDIKTLEPLTLYHCKMYRCS